MMEASVSNQTVTRLLTTDSSVNKVHWYEALISDGKVEWLSEIKIAYQRQLDAQQIPMHHLGPL